MPLTNYKKKLIPLKQQLLAGAYITKVLQRRAELDFSRKWSNWLEGLYNSPLIHSYYHSKETNAECGEDALLVINVTKSKKKFIEEYINNQVQKIIDATAQQ